MLLFCSDNHGLKHEIKSLSHWNYKHTEVRAYYPALTWNVNQLMPCDLYPEFSVISTAGQGPCIKNDQAGEWMESLRNKPKIKIYKGKGGWQKPAACSRNVECTASLIFIFHSLKTLIIHMCKCFENRVVWLLIKDLIASYCFYILFDCWHKVASTRTTLHR